MNFRISRIFVLSVCLLYGLVISSSATDTNSSFVSPPPVVPTANTIKIKKGWNFIGFDNAKDLSLDTHFSDENKIDLIWKYQNDIKQWVIYTPNSTIKEYAQEQGYIFDNNIDKTDGIWILSKQDFDYIETKNHNLSNNDISVQDGWNLLSAVDNSNISIDNDIFQNSLVWLYRDSNWYLKYNNSASTLDGINELTSIKSNEAFWIYKGEIVNEVDTYDIRKIFINNYYFNTNILISGYEEELNWDFTSEVKFQTFVNNEQVTLVYETHTLDGEQNTLNKYYNSNGLVVKTSYFDNVWVTCELTNNPEVYPENAKIGDSGIGSTLSCSDGTTDSMSWEIVEKDNKVAYKETILSFDSDSNLNFKEIVYYFIDKNNKIVAFEEIYEDDLSLTVPFTYVYTY
jgi:hypothetical protein